jgi:hypothetical protein
VPSCLCTRTDQCVSLPLKFGILETGVICKYSKNGIMFL